MSIPKIILSLLFVLFAYFQLNDPDPARWIVIYLVLATLYGFAAAGKYNKIVLGACAAAMGAYMIYLLPSLFEFFTNDDGIGITQTMSNEFLYIEEARECGGLFLGLLALFYLWRESGKAKT